MLLLTERRCGLHLVQFRGLSLIQIVLFNNMKWTLSIVAGIIIITGSLVGLRPSELAQLKTDIDTAELQCLADYGSYCQIRNESGDYKIVADVYDGPRGKGYTITVRRRVSSGIEETVYNTGGEGDRSKTKEQVCTDLISATSTNNICEL